MEYLTIVKREYAVKQIRLSFFDSGLHLMFRRPFLDEEENMNKRRISFVIVLAMVFLLFSGFVPDRAKADDVMVSYTDQPLNTDWVSYQLVGGSPSQCLDASSTVLMNMLGLVCDPVGGLVEYPCQNRNASGVANALVAAELTMAGIKQLIPFDEMLDTMYKVGKRMPVELRETALGGCAVTKSACDACGGCS